jgi:quercetin dioxygenase-like cupin family protein
VGERTEALLRPAGAGEAIPGPGVEMLFKVVGGDTGGRLSLQEFVLAPGGPAVRPHIHWEHDEYFYVVEGELTVHTGDGETTVGPGGLLAAVRGSVHGFRNASDNLVKALCVFSPAGYENYFREVHEAIASGEAMTDARMAELRSKYASETV